jgi:hypothetical protein
MWAGVSPKFCTTAGVQLLAGRWIEERDRTARPPVAVSESVL